MKKQKLFFGFALLLTINMGAQINVNPDPNGDPWWAGDGVLPSVEEIARIPKLELTSESLNTPLPYKVYNDELIFFPPIFDQLGFSCVQVAEIGYNLTYEINRARNVAAGDWYSNNHDYENLYFPLFTYNFVNYGSGSSYTFYTSGFSIVKENGCPMYSDYYDPALLTEDRFKYWMTDFNKYNLGMSNQISDYYTMEFNTSYSSLETLKHWLADHGEGEETGGISVIAVNISVYNYSHIPLESPEEPNKLMITQWGTSGGHALSIVGYNDEIWCFDINSDGEYTIDEDVDGDSDVDLFDCEKGAFKIANSWGVGFGNDGFIFVPYKLMVSGLQWPNTSYCCKSQGNYEPKIEIKTSINYPQRNELRLDVGFAQNANQTNPVGFTTYNSFHYQGGPYEMRGAYSGPIEIGLNYGYWYLNEDVGKIFFIIEENESSTQLEGLIEYFSLLDYRWNEEFELYCDVTNVPIVNDGETVLSIDYDLISHEVAIDEDLSLFSNMVSRFNPTVTNGATLTIEDGVGIDMYNSEIHIMAGSTLVIEDNAVITAKRGRCKLIIDGNLICGSNVRFDAVEDADLELLLNNNSLQVTFGNSSFERIRLDSYAQSLNLSNSEFRNCIMISSHRGNVTVTNNCTFIGTGLYVENTEDNNNTATISNCNFTNNLFIAAIDVWNYNQYDISNNTINGYYNGIQIVQSGYGLTKKQTIQDNTITNCSQKGILAYNTLGSVYRNHISNNNYGVWFGDHSGIKLYGNSGALNNNQTQEICNNASYEVYASQYSFPVYFRYNVIIDEDNTGAPDDPLVYYSAGSGDNNLRDVSRNCWGENFDASEDLYPSGYAWSPTWCPGIGDSNTSPPDEDMYEVANSLFENENYVGAKGVYEMLIDQYPQSKFAKAALQELFALEKFVSSDYSSLKQYYATNSTIQSDSILVKTAGHLASKCDVKTENWADAISYYENIILNPETMEDSIFAIIDLGYVYFVMENSGYKSAYLGQLTQYRPETKDQFIKNRDYLLSLIPGDQKSKTIKENVAWLKEGEIMQNVPNPFASTTQIAFKLNTECDVKISISDYTGKSLKTINVGVKETGTHSITFSAQNFNPGIYFYTLITNGIPTETRKMIILK